MIRKRIIGLWLAVCAPLVSSACVNNGGEGEGGKPSIVTVDEVCGGVFSGPGEQLLRALGVEGDFYQDERKRKEAVAESLLRSREAGRDGVSSEVTLCSIAPQIDGLLGHVRIRFMLADRGVLPSGEHAKSLHPYELGEWSLAGVKRSYLYFKCVSPRITGSTTNPLLVSGELFDRYPPEEDTPQLREANLAALNHAALAVARELKCENDAGLVEKPKLTPVSSS